MGYALEAFEKNIANLPQGEKFEFDLSVEEAYGEYLQEHVIKLPKDIFNINGKFDEARIFPGNVIPLANEDGNHFEGIVKEILDDTVEIDLNHPLAGKPLHFKGTIITTRTATIEEMEKFVNDLNGDEDCECCQNKEQCGDHHGDCCHHDEGCQHGGCGCGHHHCH